jgi:hypothetical protein
VYVFLLSSSLFCILSLFSSIYCLYELFFPCILLLLPFFIAIRLLRYLSVGCFFNSFPCSFAYILSSGDATGLRGTFPGHPRPFHLTFTDIHNNIYTPMGALPDGTRTRADLAVVAERVLILPSTTLPSAPRRHTHTSMAGRSFLPLKKSSPFGGIRTH